MLLNNQEFWFHAFNIEKGRETIKEQRPAEHYYYKQFAKHTENSTYWLFQIMFIIIK